MGVFANGASSNFQQKVVDGVSSLHCINNQNNIIP
jgi:hypothetical protein